MYNTFYKYHDRWHMAVFAWLRPMLKIYYEEAS